MKETMLSHKLSQAEATITSIDYIAQKGFQVTTSTGEIFNSENTPDIANYTESALLELEQLHQNQSLSDEQKQIISKSHEAKEEMGKSINDFINKVAAIRSESSRKVTFEKNKEMIDLISLVPDKSLKEEMMNKFLENDSIMSKTNFENIKKGLENGYIDVLTGCYSKDYFQYYLSTENTKFNRKEDQDEFNALLEIFNKNGTEGVMFLDINNFKLVNDYVDHDAGDRILKKLGDELAGFSQDTISIRSGGDEFLVFGSVDKLSQIENHLNKSEVIEHLNSHISKDSKYNGVSIQSTVSKGIKEIHIPKHIGDISDVLNFKFDLASDIKMAEEFMKNDKKRIKEESGLSYDREDGEKAEKSGSECVEEVLKEQEASREISGRGLST